MLEDSPHRWPQRPTFSLPVPGFFVHIIRLCWPFVTGGVLRQEGCPSRANLLRRVGPTRAGHFGLRASVERTEQNTLRREFTAACLSSARWALRLARACRSDRSTRRRGTK